ncbi:MAG: RraA family protein [Rhodospirillaceae bacterium]|nr:RraA family protein [Rhodospirillaceae bacterium]
MASPDLAAIRTQLFAAVLSDCLDQVGVTKQALPPRTRPLDEESVMVGRAPTAAYMEVYAATPGENPYELEIALVDSLRPGEIPVFACSNPQRVGPWGGLLSTAARVRGAAGALMDGCVRDIEAIRTMGFPVFHGGIAPVDSRGKRQDHGHRRSHRMRRVPVAPGDLVFGDADGVVVIPQRVAAEVLRLAFEKVAGERDTLRELEAGRPLSEVFARHGIL